MAIFSFVQADMIPFNNYTTVIYDSLIGRVWMKSVVCSLVVVKVDINNCISRTKDIVIGNKLKLNTISSKIKIYLYVC